MGWFIGYQSALEFWRRASAHYALAGKKLRIYSLADEPADVKEVYGEGFWGLAKPLHVLVSSSNARKVNRSLKCHINSRKFPAGSFLRMPSGLIVSSPELSFAQLAAELSLIELILLGFELCGGYRLDAAYDPDRGFRDDLPLTNVAKLESYLNKLPGTKGHKNACRALRFIVDGAASPMEAILTMLLTLPYKLGGYGFPKPLLNAAVDVQVGTAAVKSRLYCDLYWPDEQVDVEYDSDAYHTTADQVYKDASRRNALSSSGVTVVTVSRKQVASTAELDKTAEVLSKLLEKSLQYKTSEFPMRRAELRAQLLPKSPK